MRAVIGVQRLKIQLLAALAGTSVCMTSGCGGNVSADGSNGGSAGSGTGGSAATSSGGTGFGGGGVGGSGTGGMSTGGTGFGGGGTGGTGGTGVGGSAGYACSDPDSTGMIVCGELECQNCYAEKPWLTCWRPEQVPVYPGAELGPDGVCPLAHHVMTTGQYEPCEPDYQYIYFSEGVLLDGQLCCYDTSPACPGGRPFRVAGELRTATVVKRRDWAERAAASDDALDPVTARALSDAWLGDAKLEHASIAAFARLTLELLHLGAPPELVAQSQAASLDEIRHAKGCFALASRWSEHPLGPGQLDLGGELFDLDLARLVETTFEEGCVGETIAALIASEALAQATDPQVRDELARIARDEARHAELAWRIVGWALRVGGARIRNVLRGAMAKALERERTIALPALAADVDRAAWARYGRLTPEELADVRCTAFAELIAPCLRALLEPRAEAEPELALR